jgi:hypothetical protein
MKLNLIAVMAAILITGTATAQHVNFGIKGGVNLYNIHNDNNVALDNSIGLHLGLLAHIHMAQKFALQPELVFSMQGANYKNGNSDTEINLNYVNMPLLFQYMFDNGFRLQAGPQLGFLVNAKSKIGNTSIDTKDNFKGVDLGASVGMSYVSPPSGFGFDVRYNIGLSNINENSAVNSNNRGLQLGIFYLFKHKS